MVQEPERPFENLLSRYLPLPSPSNKIQIFRILWYLNEFSASRIHKIRLKKLLN